MTIAARSYNPGFEESYGVGTCGEFWLECLARLAQQVPKTNDAPDLALSVADIRRTGDDRLLRDRCLGALLDYARREDKRLVIGVENLNMMFSDMADPNVGWCLRKTLQTEPRIMLIGTATSRFGEIDRPDRALYDLFRVLTLKPLSSSESAALCARVSGEHVTPGSARRLQILAGGNPRLLAIMARFAGGRSFRALMSDLLDLVDEHTAYFKSHLESLPRQERRVYQGLLALWKPATAREVAERTRLGTSECSAQLRRLIGRGVVLPAGGTNRRKQYYVSERLYNIYYLLRRSVGGENLVEPLVKFMAAFYSADELQAVSDEMVTELEDSDALGQQMLRAALERLARVPAVNTHFLKNYPQHVSEEVREAAGLAWAFLDRSTARLVRADFAGALRELGQLPNEDDPTAPGAVRDARALAMASKGSALLGLGRWEDARKVSVELGRRFRGTGSPQMEEALAGGLFNLASAWSGLDRTQDALAAYEDLLRRHGSSQSPPTIALVVSGQVNKALELVDMGREDEAIKVLEGVVTRFGDRRSCLVLDIVGEGMIRLSALLGVCGRASEQFAVCDDLLSRLDRHDDLVAAGDVLDNDPATVVALRAAAHEVRVYAHLKANDTKLAEPDVLAVLRLLPNIGAIPERTIRMLMVASLWLGTDRMAEMIRSSPSAALLLPLTTALEREAGLQPRVAIEVDEVAEDVRRELARLRQQIEK